MKNKRDISIIDIDKKKSLVIACDVSGGIGKKENDQLKVDPKIVGEFTAKVALMEVLAVNAKPISITNTLSVEYDPTGIEIIKGIKKALGEVGLKEILNGSTEDNIKTYETGVGITVIAIVDKEKLKLSNSHKGDIIAAIGIPLVGEDVIEKSELIATLSDVKNLRKKNYIKEILPVGSKGIKYEAQILAEMSNCKLSFKKNLDLDIMSSAGPGTVVLVSLSEDNYLNLRKDFSYKTISIIAKLI